VPLHPGDNIIGDFQGGTFEVFVWVSQGQSRSALAHPVRRIASFSTFHGYGYLVILN